MHIAIDARMYGTAQRGIGRYLIKLLEHLEIVDTNNQYTIFLRRTNFDEYTPCGPNFRKALWDVPWYGVREQLAIRPLLSAGVMRGQTHDRGFSHALYPIDLYHFPHWNVPLLFHKPFIVTIHDLELFSSNRTRENTTRGRLMYWFKFQMFKIIFRHAVLSARAIIVPSNVVREQLLDMYPQVRKKVHVVYEAPTLVNSPQTIVHSNNKTIDSKLTTNNYVLYVGAAYPHKNLVRLLEAWKLIYKALPNYKLILVGREDFFWRQLKSTYYLLPACAGRPTTSSIIFYGEATDAELSTLYQNAALLVQPSLEEGFSLPPLEALSFGCPVAVSDIPVHREILKDTPLYFDPRDVQSIVNVLLQTLGNPSVRQNIITRGKVIVGQYSWPRHAQETLNLYHQVTARS